MDPFTISNKKICKYCYKEINNTICYYYIEQNNRLYIPKDFCSKQCLLNNIINSLDDNEKIDIVINNKNNMEID